MKKHQNIQLSAKHLKIITHLYPSMGHNNHHLLASCVQTCKISPTCHVVLSTTVLSKKYLNFYSIKKSSNYSILKRKGFLYIIMQRLTFSNSFNFFKFGSKIN